MIAIVGFAQLLESSTPPPTAEQRDSLGQIHQAGWYLLELINEALDLALIESGKFSLSPEAVSLTDVLNDCTECAGGLHRRARDFILCNASTGANTSTPNLMGMPPKSF